MSYILVLGKMRLNYEKVYLGGKKGVKRGLNVMFRIFMKQSRSNVFEGEKAISLNENR